MKSLSLTALALVGVASPSLAQTVQYDSDGFEAPHFQVGTLAGSTFSNGQDGWLATANLGGDVNLSQIQVQSLATAFGAQAVSIDATGHNCDYFHLRRNTQFDTTSSPGEPIVDVRAKVRISSSAQPSEAWAFQAQAGPATGIYSWDVHPDGHVHYVDFATGLEVDTGYVFARDGWHDVVTSVDSVSGEITVTIDDAEVVRFPGDTGATWGFFAFHSFANFGPGDDHMLIDDFRIELRPRRSVIGTNYCTAATNSTGAAASISALGSDLAADGDVVLQAEGLPQSTYGIFLCSQTTGFVPNPGGSAGNLCLGGAIGRYTSPDQVRVTGTLGIAGLTLDLGQTPTPNTFVPVQAGQTWNFQFWFRDNDPNPTSNFTDALAITFQ